MPTTIPSTRPSSDNLYVAVAVSAAAVFVADRFLALGIAVWVLYFVPIGLSTFAWRPSAPLFTAAACTILLVVDFVLSMATIAPEARYSELNRTFGFVTMWVAAFIGRQFILSRLKIQRQERLNRIHSELSTRLEGEQSHEELANNVLTELAENLGARVGAMYVSNVDGSFHRFGSYAFDPEATASASIQPGEGLVGQALRDNRLMHVSDVPDNYSNVRSSLGTHRPSDLLIAPASADGKVEAVVELGFLNGLNPLALDLFPRISQSIASAVRSVNYRERQQALLDETQRQAEQLQTQQEELRVQNEELEQQSRTLQESQTALENQQAELEQINSQLEEQTQALEQQKDDLARSKGELERANSYKSEFLANMSHELRTPLNSSLILAKLLLDNREGNLTAEQVKFAQTIYSAGNDLLTLINDVLDLSKIEAGKADVQTGNIVLSRMLGELANTFEPVARDKSVAFSTAIEPGVPPSMLSDATRLQQILKNLLSNALKFTDTGSVSLEVRRASDGRLAFVVQDTGIGIAPHEQEVIFEAFRQADGTTNRKYGGTGLGLSISRDLARLLGGELSVESSPGRGSTFTLLVPERLVLEDPGPAAQRARPSSFVPERRPIGSTPAAAPRRESAPRPIVSPVEDDRDHLSASARTILVIEDDLSFAGIIKDLAHELGFQALMAQTGEEGLELALRFQPSAIVLDIGLPDRSGLSVLDTLKHETTTRHIPVHVISASDYARTALEMGAACYGLKPVPREQLVTVLRRLEAKFTQKLRRVLVVEDDPVHRDSICMLLASDEVETLAVGTAAEALEQLRSTTFDCMVLDLTLPDRTGIDLLEEMSQQETYAFPPVIVYTGRSLSREEEQNLRRFSHSIIIKGARSPERLLDEVTLFLHQVEATLPPDRQRMLRDARHREVVFEGRRVLVVEDDVRNIFALSSVLEPKGAKVEIARNGREALEHLRAHPGVDLVLMDIMMPEMDGLEATRRIRAQPEIAKVPIIALTAKAMIDDRENCLAAGANDYITKPLDVDKLLSLARIWLPK
ncbi:MAG TPA: response regulator [Polyangiaceae bacterium]|nr:response regulator [Polyangiaceae bacterium]